MFPNWDKENEYPDPTSMTLEGWAWEFLRRNRKYQVQWDEYLKLRAALSEKHKLPSQLLPDPGMAKEWGLEEMFNPAATWLEVAGSESRPRFLNQQVPAYVVGDLGSPHDMWLQEVEVNLAVVRIDMAQSIAGQLEKLLPVLEAKQEKLISEKVIEPSARRGANTKYYRDLLRIFDAYQAKNSEKTITNKSIADAIYEQGEGSAEAIARRYAVAAEYVNKKGYLRLLF